MSSADPTGLQTFPDALASREAWLEPFDWYREMRETAPVRWDPDRRCWDVFRYDDVKTALGDDEAFSVDVRTATNFEASDDATALFLESMLRQDPPRHDELRGVVDDAFGPTAVAELEPRIRELTDDLLEEALAGGGRMDVIEDLAYPLPVIVIAELLGIPPEERDRFKAWSDTLVEVPAADTDGLDGAAAQREMATYFLDELAERREAPRDDLLSTIATGELDDGSRLSEEAALGMCMLLLVAGNITTTNLIGNAVRCVANHGVFGTVDDERALGTAIEEVLRYRSPVQAMTRIAASDVTLGDEQLQTGDEIVLWLGSANRDGRQFPEADAFVPDRTPNRHLGFGYGTHYCLGAPLARLEAKAALSELLDRVDDVELVGGDLSPVRSSFVYGVESLPVEV